MVTAHICQPAWFAAADRYADRPGWRKRVFRAVVTRLDRLVMLMANEPDIDYVIWLSSFAGEESPEASPDSSDA